MADDHDDFAEWRGNIESRVTTLERTVETEASVRAQMDQDMSDLKLQFDAQRKLLQAMSETQSEHTATLREHSDRLTRLGRGVNRLELGQTMTLASLQTIIGLLDRDIEGGTKPDASPGTPE